jgi:hypothetical protein
MTPRERGQKVWEDTQWHESSDNINVTIERIAEQVQEAVAQEREACYEIAMESLLKAGDPEAAAASRDIATAIRARGSVRPLPLTAAGT